MARIQVLPLPVEKTGVCERTPFVLVVDEAAGVFADLELDVLRELTGAAALICVNETITVVGGLELSEGQREAIMQRLEGMA